MSNFVPTKDVLRGSLITFFHMNKTAAESYRLLVEAYGQHGPTQEACERWFARFKNGDFDTDEMDSADQPIKLEHGDEENCCQAQEEFSLSLGVKKQKRKFKA